MPKPKRQNFGFRLTIVVLFWLAALMTIVSDVKLYLDAGRGIMGPVTRFVVAVGLVYVIIKTDMVRFTWRFLTNTLPGTSENSAGSGSSDTSAGLEDAGGMPMSAPGPRTLVIEGDSPQAKEFAKALRDVLEPPPRWYRIFNVFFYLLVFAGAIYFVILLINGGR